MDLTQLQQQVTDLTNQIDADQAQLKAVQQQLGYGTLVNQLEAYTETDWAAINVILGQDGAKVSLAYTA